MKSYWFQSKSSKYKADDTDLFFGNDVEHVTQETREKQGIRYVWGVMDSKNYKVLVPFYFSLLNYIVIEL